jgi:hypothetical protein
MKSHQCLLIIVVVTAATDNCLDSAEKRR